MTPQKRRDYSDLTVPTATREPESRRDLAAEDERLRTRDQNLEDLTQIRNTMTGTQGQV